MKMRDAAEVTLGLMGVYSIVHAVVYLPFLANSLHRYFALRQEENAALRIGPSLMSNFGTFAANLIVGILLVLLAGRIADWLTRRSASAATADVELRIVSREGFRFCVKLIGITVLIAGVARLVEWDDGHLLFGALILALGLYLVLGGAWLTRFAWGEAEA